ncbi:MAG: methyltransferase domain-containing protein [Proteobacteria bacterium]|jgi:malonyl-CoA O-methyltransferase|nr:methyltransferase domain-containing protein [Pseudomonadota bacterium]
MHNNYKLITNKLNQQALNIKSLDFIFNETAKRMSERLDYIKIQPQTILDIGSGLNIDANYLQQRFPRANLYKLDIAINVIKEYKSKLNFIKKIFYNNSQNICANAISLPIQSQTMDLVWSNLTLPYITDLESYFKEIRRVLKVNGCFLVTGIGVDSLKQLRTIGLNTYNFPDMHIIGDILVKLGFKNPVTDLEYITLEYTSAQQLLSDIRIIGCGAATNKYSFITKERIKKIMNNFEQLSQNGKIPLTIELFYAHAWKDKINIELPDNEKILRFSPRT